MNSKFLVDIEAIRKQARNNLQKGAVTENYKIDLDTMYDMLNSALATEMICTLRYKQHYFKATELGATIAAEEFLEHSNQEQQHADQIAERIVQLGGQPNFNPATFSAYSHADYVDCNTVAEMVRENLIAERIAIDIYREMILFLGDNDSTTRKMIEEILAVEEEHADDLLDIAKEYNISLTDN
ncbi:ferritin-like domain-containing protein [Legionella gresilensis]|uniref:ferritin-like domain-containing protein n=1 Tax=Legionella gresilensis TaxID=91823 RepID=UPI00104160B6|nr:ferritin-like domain-containing protein [Legionella gresilensis]